MPANSDIAAIFSEMADILDIQGANPFRVRAYRNAVRTLEGLSKSVSDMVTEDPEMIERIPGIGEALQEKIIEFVKTGKVTEAEELKTTIPPGLLDMLKVPSFGPKRVKLVYDTLGIDSVDMLERAAADGQIRELPGMGEKSEAKLLRSIREFRTLHTARTPWPLAAGLLEPYLAYLRQAPGIDRIAAAGSYRRCRETIGDLDILVTIDGEARPVIDHFVAYPEVAEVLAQGDTKGSVILNAKVQVDLRVVAPESFGAALQYFTGSKEHNVAMRSLAKEKGLKVSEYGVFEGDKSIAGRTEEEVYKAVGLELMPPEIRENRGEVEAALTGSLPKLVTADDIVGDLHVRCEDDDGKALTAQCAAAQQHGWEYLVAVRAVNEDNEVEVREWCATIGKTKTAIPVIAGIEAAIGPDGALGVAEETLAAAACVFGAIVDAPGSASGDMTARLCAALAQPGLHCLARPLGHHPLGVPDYEVDAAALVEAAHAHGRALEICADPERLDIDERAADMARAAGVPLFIGTYARDADELVRMRYGLNIARRAWCPAAVIGNTWTLAQMQKWLSTASRG
jgi:DNA polymerase (family 10)